MIIKATHADRNAAASTVELAELTTATVDSGEDRLRNEAARIIAEAKREAERIRRQAAAEGRREGEQAARDEWTRRQSEQWATVMPALEGVVEEVRRARQAWLRHWEQSAVGTAVLIAGRVLRRELANHPDVTVELVREALELAAGQDRVRVLLNPGDHCALGNRVDQLAGELGGLGAVEVTADPTISAGGCRVETRFGTIDQQFETQLARIEQELTGTDPTDLKR